ncbi:hypothetical protein AK812_SmicGene43213 [Symbiodinium microadriaticum]|uniref:Uncharacterized protein n=1 Tax=Symbiodinium microadriaticum TaxID=2951 RepID=A0A1Q9C1K6_SYMMI|nr:hypothetical protein AK812_SmicGene43213 [Symbiodinium microadriaticum]
MFTRNIAKLALMPYQTVLLHCVEDFGPRFGSWGRRGCPKSLAEIVNDVHSGTSEAEGGKSGTKPLISARFVVKVIDKTEHKQLGRLLQKLRGSRQATLPTTASLPALIFRNVRHVLQRL